MNNNFNINRHLLSNDTYTCGWCCGVSSATVGNIQIIPVSLSILLGIMLLFILVKISIHYLHLHQQRQNQKVLGKNSSIYETFNAGNIYEEDKIKTTEYSSLQSNEPLMYESPTEFDLQRPLGDFTSDESDDYIEIENDNDNNDYDSIPKIYHLDKLKDYSKSKTKTYPIRWFHFIYLVVAAGWFLLQSLVLLSSSEDPLIRLIDTFLYEGHAIIDTAIVIVSFFPIDSMRYISLGLLCTIIVVSLSSFTAALYSLSGDCSTCSFFFPATEAFYTYTIFALFYALCLILLYSKFRYKPRKTVQYWIWYLLIVYSLAMIGSGIVNFGGYDIGFCVMNGVIILYSVIYAPLLYFTISRDSNYLSKENEPQTQKTLTTSPLVARAHDLVQKHSVGWIPFEEIIIGEKIGYGSAGEVYTGFFLQTPVAIKRLFDNKSQVLEDFFREVTLMSKLSHPNILLFMGVCVRDNGDRYIITEMMNKGSVFDILHPSKSYTNKRNSGIKNKLTSERIQQILLQSARAMSYLHSFNPPILHRDLKTHNLLVDDHWNIKVADFGLSRAQSTKTMSAAGTPQWSAPEVIRQEKYTTKADVYSFGIIIYEVISRKIPYANMGPLSAARQVAYDHLRPIFPDDCDKSYIILAEKCWSSDPNSRPSFAQIIQQLNQLSAPILPRNYHVIG